VPATWEGAEKDSVDVYQLHAQLYRVQEDGWDVYLRVLTYTTWLGEPTRYPRVSMKTYATTSGSDTHWIRRVIQLLDAFKEAIVKEEQDAAPPTSGR
jgi:hypothetical protein